MSDEHPTDPSCNPSPSNASKVEAFRALDKLSDFELAAYLDDRRKRQEVEHEAAKQRSIDATDLTVRVGDTFTIAKDRNGAHHDPDLIGKGLSDETFCQYLSDAVERCGPRGFLTVTLVRAGKVAA